MKNLILSNNRHNTSAVIEIKHVGKVFPGDRIYLIGSQVKKAREILCPDYCCGKLGIQMNSDNITFDAKFNNHQVRLKFDTLYFRYEDVDLIIEQVDGSTGRMLR